MKDVHDLQTVEVFQAAKRGRGRPVTGSAMTNAERQKRYRQSLKTKNVTVTKNPQSDIAFDIACNQLAKARVEIERLKSEIEQLKSVTVTEKQGQGSTS
jgi:hypothetical protein